MELQLGTFRINERMIPYNDFVSRFYNLCISYGFEPGKIMPSQSFCPDENQGFPIILITKHFGTYPFNHAHIGGVVATDRHGPHAHHGKDLVIIQASHVGYDPDSKHFGSYRRLQHTEDHAVSDSCGKICAVLGWYTNEYAFACENIRFGRLDSEDLVFIDNLLLDSKRESGIFIHLNRLVETEEDGMLHPVLTQSTSKAFRIHPEFKKRLPDSVWQQGKKVPIGKELTSDMFYFKKDIVKTIEGSDHLENNLISNMPEIVTSQFPPLTAAQVNTQVEFDRTYRTIIKEREYHGKNLAFISGMNIDIPPLKGGLFPLTRFVPWAAFIQTQDGRNILLEQDELFDVLQAQPIDNKEQVDLEHAICVMAGTPCKILLVDDERDFVQTLSDRLKLRSIKTDIAYDGESALECVQQDDPPEVIILDIQMPGINGVETLQRVKKTNPDIEVIIITGHVDEDDRKTCLSAGAFAYIQKPLDINELSMVLHDAAEKRKSRNPSKVS